MGRKRGMGWMRLALGLPAAMLLCGMWGCAVRPMGLLYTNIRMPLTKNLHHTPVPEQAPHSARTMEIREPLTGVGIYVEVDSNAIGEIARQHGMERLYFADRQFFSVLLGIWTTDKTILHGE